MSRNILPKAYMKLLKLAAHIIPLPKPTLLTGAGSSAQLCMAVGQLGYSRVLVVTDKSLVELGIASNVIRHLEQAGVEAVVFDGVLPDPTYSHVESGLECYQQNRCQAILALGGGSPIDCAKVIAARVTNTRRIARLAGLLKVWRWPAPLFAIPTTAGTGSEVTIAAVVSRPDDHQKTPLMDPKLVPMMAALDGSLMLNLPPYITAATGMDALTHAIEAYLSVNATPETDAYARAAVTLIGQNLVSVVKNGHQLHARQELAMASYYAGLAFTRASLGYVHAIAHQLGAKYSTPHGVANAMVLPHVLDYSLPAAEERMSDLARWLGVFNYGDNVTHNARALAEHIRQMLAELGLPQQHEQLHSGDIPELARLALKEAHWNYPVPRYLDQVRCEALLRNLLK